ncbi:UNVERIFIED_CONTAM: hypothetical protein HDU68_003981, partial [Siphonaria sp. JEL0065]
SVNRLKLKARLLAAATAVTTTPAADVMTTTMVDDLDFGDPLDQLFNDVINMPSHEGSSYFGHPDENAEALSNGVLLLSGSLFGDPGFNQSLSATI